MSTDAVIRLTGAETGDSSAFSAVGAVRWLSDGRILVADEAARRMWLFDSAGRYRSSLGRKGAGPGEFRQITSLNVLPGDTLTTFDAGLRRLSVWHPDAGFLRGMSVGGGSLESWPADAWLWQDSLLAVLQVRITPVESLPPATGIRRWPMRARLTLHDSAGRLVATSPSFDGMYSGLYASGDTRLPFSNQPFAAATRERLYFGSGQQFSIRYLGQDFKLAGEIRWRANEEELTQAEVNQVRSEAEALVASRSSAEQARVRVAPSFASTILPAMRPAIGRLLVASDGAFWVERFEATRLGTRVQKAADRWSIISADGEPVARLALPPNARLEAVDGARLILVVRDSLDLQTVEVHHIYRR